MSSKHGSIAASQNDDGTINIAGEKLTEEGLRYLADACIQIASRMLAARKEPPAESKQEERP